jgi:hypothetical protein
VPVEPKPRDATEDSPHHYHGSISIVPIPSTDELPKMSERVARNLRRGSIEATRLPPRTDQPPRAVPERIGEPSLIRHVVYVIKENRTYDQIFGALGKGRGKPELCVFGKDITPNQHKLVDEFVLLDNTYCSGILSADGHQWSTTAFSTDYMEKSFAGFPGVTPTEWVTTKPTHWPTARRIFGTRAGEGNSIRNYGEFMKPRVRYARQTKGMPPFADCLKTWR